MQRFQSSLTEGLEIFEVPTNFDLIRFVIFSKLECNEIHKNILIELLI
jgi:hypothetical protein